jgi:hypothetical protein
MTSFRNLALIGALVACTSLPALARGGGGGGGGGSGAGSAASASSSPSAASVHQSTGITSTNPAQPGSISIQNPALTRQPGTTATSPAQPGTTAQPSTTARTTGGPGAGASDQSVGIANTNPTQPGAISIQNSGMTTQPATTAITPAQSRTTGVAGVAGTRNNAEAMRKGTNTILQAGAVSAPGVGVGHAANGLPIGAPGSGLGSPSQPIGSGPGSR